MARIVSFRIPYMRPMVAHQRFDFIGQRPQDFAGFLWPVFGDQAKETPAARMFGASSWASLGHGRH
jgi:hypothetical protein